MMKNKWVAWIAQALTQGVTRKAIIQVLIQQGYEHPQTMINEVLNHPLFAWGHTHYKDSRQKQYYLNLQAQLWRAQLTVPRVQKLSAQQFFNDFYYTNHPVMIEDWANQWPATQYAWRPERFIQDFGEVAIEYVAGRSSHATYDIHAQHLIQHCTLASYAQKVLETNKEENDFYMIARNHVLDNPKLAILLDEIDESLYCDPIRRTGSMALWFGPQGTITPLHHDTCQIMFVQIWGSKRLILIPPHRMDLYERSHHMYSTIDPEKEPVDPDQVTIDLQAGEALFIPVAWWHHVRSLSPSISLAMTHFKRSNAFDWYRPGDPLKDFEKHFKKSESLKT